MDQRGNLQTGLAIDTAPYLLFFGSSVSLPDYAKRPSLRFLARTGLSIGATRGASESDKSAKLAFGLTFTFLDLADPRTDQAYLGTLAAVAARVLQSAPPLSPTATSEERLKWQTDIAQKVENDPEALRARSDQRRASWNRSSWTLAVAPNWISPDGSTAAFAANGTAAWTSISYGFEGIPGLKDAAQLVAHVRFHSNEAVPDASASGTTYRQKSFVAGLRLRFGNADSIGSLEGAYLHTDPVDRKSEDYLRISLGAERRLSDNTWLHVGIGGESGQRDGKQRLFILGAFQWGVGPKSP
ncbi:MAG: hypothetical protein IPN83_07085 [Holophagales bacterium]|nr:hypothetical protein [Holophagales bacterium]